jgi:hypothetical protein
LSLNVFTHYCFTCVADAMVGAVAFGRMVLFARTLGSVSGSCERSCEPSCPTAVDELLLACAVFLVNLKEMEGKKGERADCEIRGGTASFCVHCAHSRNCMSTVFTPHTAATTRRQTAELWPSWETSSLLAGRTFPRLLCSPKVHYCLQHSPSLGPDCINPPSTERWVLPRRSQHATWLCIC